MGRANDVVSYVGHYEDDTNGKTSKEWAILSRDSSSGTFSAKGDSGSVIVDGLGRIDGLIYLFIFYLFIECIQSKDYDTI